MPTLARFVSFTAATGGEPTAGLIADAAGNLFGTTSAGGPGGAGTVFEIARTATGFASTPTVVASFTGSNGSSPLGGLFIDAAGNLLGTTSKGGASNDGTVFEIPLTAAGYAATPTILFSFSGTNGAVPRGTLIADAAGDLFGTTTIGGANNAGTVFEIPLSNGGYAAAPVTLAGFGAAAGQDPYAGLVFDAAGNLFGTTAYGGPSNDGTAFEIAKTGTGYASTPATLTAFTGFDGANPMTPLIVDAAGDLFGTTNRDGAQNGGTLFEIAKTSGGYATTPATLINFGGAIGSFPQQLLADAAGDLFGATATSNGDGSVFELAKIGTAFAGTPTMLINFNGANGEDPVAGLLADAAGDLFGTTFQGGGSGLGEAFEVTGTGFQAGVAVPPAVTGTVARQPVTDVTTVMPFATVVVADPNVAQTDTVVVTPSAAGNGTLSSLDGGSYNAATGVYSVAGSPAAVTAALDGLIFTPTVHQAAAGQTVTTSFTITVTDTAGQSVSNTTTSVVATETAASASLSAVTAACQAILRVAPAPAAAAQTAAQIDAGQTTIAAYEASLLASDQTLYTTLPALVSIDAFYGATPQSATLTTVAASAGSPSQIGGFYSAAWLHGLGYSDANVWTIMASQWGADQTSEFYQTLGGYATDYTGFINAIYDREFGGAPSATALQALLGDVPGVAALLGGGAGAATPIQIGAGLFGYLLYVGQTTPALLTPYAAPANAFLLAAAQGTVSYGPELTTEFPPTSNAAAAATMPPTAPVAAAGGEADTGGITIAGSDQLIDPGTGSHMIQFLAESGADTVVPHTGGEDRISGFDLNTDVLDLRSLLTGTGFRFGGGSADLSNYLTVVDQGADALLRFDPSGHGGGTTVAILQGLGFSVTGSQTLIAHGAVRVW